MKEHQGQTNGNGLSFAIVASRYNQFITGKLVDGAREALTEQGVSEQSIKLFWCPGALEIPLVAQRIASKGVNARHFDAIIAIGCVIRGETDHYTHVATEAVRGVTEVALKHEIAVGNAILTVENIQQANERSGEKSLNKGYEAALVALELVNLFRSMK